MKTTISARHFEASEKLQQFANNELLELEKHFEGDLIAQLILDEAGSLKTVELRVTAFGRMLPAKVEGSDFYKLIPKAVVKVEKQLKSVKSKLTSR